jgi:DNA mismatch repair protein MutS
MSQESAQNATPFHAVNDRSAFQSILFDRFQAELASHAPEFFPDLNLDQVVASITARRDEYDLLPFFHTPLHHPELVKYRQDVFRDLENRKTLDSIRCFSEKMHTMRSHLALSDKLYHRYQKEGWFLEAIEVYGDAVAALCRKLNAIHLRSKGLLSFRDYMNAYAESSELATLVAGAQKLAQSLSGIKYCLHINGNRVAVKPYESEPDYAADVLQTFERFRQGAGRQYRFQFASSVEMNHVEAAILDLLTRLHPGIFASLDEYFDGHRAFLNRTVERFDREIQFYISVIDHIDRLKESGLRFCLPIVSDRSKEVCGREIFDLALANSLFRLRRSPYNDSLAFELTV